MLTDTVRLIGQLRNEGRAVLVHCVASQSRTPTVAAHYGARKLCINGKAALREVTFDPRVGRVGPDVPRGHPA